MKPFFLKCQTTVASFVIYKYQKRHKLVLRHLLICGLHRAHYRLDPPSFLTAQRSSLNNLHHITDITTILFIVSQNFLSFPNYLFIKGMLITPHKRDSNSFVHTVTCNMTCPELAMSSPFFVQLYPPNQLKPIISNASENKITECWKFDETAPC